MKIKLSQITLLISLAGLVLSCPDEEKCLSCNIKKEKCEACEDSFVQRNTGKCNLNIPEKIENCKQYEYVDEIRCIECAGGYIFSQNYKSCLKCEVQNCALCSDDQQCLACFGNRKLNQKENKCGNKEQKCNLNNCDVCAMQGAKEYCHECSNGFVLDRTNNFEVCIKGPENCRWVSRTNGVSECLLCRFGFHISSKGECVPNKDLSENKNWISRLFEVFNPRSTSVLI